MKLSAQSFPRFTLSFLAVTAGVLACLGSTSLDNGFDHPPPAARPWVYWFIMDGNLSREGITADLEAMHRAGIGGVILMEVDMGVPRGPVKFMSPEWQDLFRHAVKEAQRLGLQITLNAGPGWTGSGGPWVKPEQSMQHLVASETNVSGPIRFDAILPRPQPRKPFFGEGALPPEQEKARKEFYRDEVVLAFPALAGGFAIPDIDEKAWYVRAPYSSQPGVKPFLPAPAEFPPAPADACIPASRIIDLTRKLSPDGRINWDVPEGNWTILRFGRTTTGQNTRPAPLPGLGLESDKFDPKALDAHFSAFIETLLLGLGRPNKDGAGWTMLHIDSWEMSAQNWTAQFRNEFIKRRGYDPVVYLPVMTGRVVENLEVSERFLWDLRQTGQELIVQNHAAHLKELGRRHGFGLSIEPYDMNPCSDLTLGGVADVPMCEFWAKGYGFATEFSCFEATSIAHTMGRPIVAAESFTAGDGERWQLYPGAMKSQGDWALCTGINRIVFHRYQHQPWLDRVPGMTMGDIGSHWERTQTWWELVPAFHQYLTRCQFMLRRGLPVADICYLSPEGAPNVFRPPKSATRGNPPDRQAYNFDGCSPEALMQRMSVKNGHLVLPDGMSYRVLVLPEFDTMTPALLRKIRDLARDGAIIVGRPPSKSPSLAHYPACDDEVQRVAREVWGEVASESPGAAIDRPFGKGRVVSFPRARATAAALNPLSSAKWIWRAEGSPAASAPVGKRFFQRAFVLAPDRRFKTARLAMTADNRFDAFINGHLVGTGDNFHETYSFDVTEPLKPGTNILAVSVENSGTTPNPAGLIGCLMLDFEAGENLTIPTDHEWTSAPAAAQDWRAQVETDWLPSKELGPWDMSPWNKKSDQAPIPEIYPDFSQVAALLAKMGTLPDFESNIPLRYTHRSDARTDLYFVSYPGEHATTSRARFRVTGKQPELWDAVTGEQRALPDFSEIRGQTEIPLRFEPNQSFFVVFRQPAKNDAKVKSNFSGTTPVAEVKGPWDVTFQDNRGAPRQLKFELLTDWTKHPDPGVRNFSGIATYRTRFDWNPGRLAPGTRVFLDVGEVHVMAGVKLNGQDLGIAWTAPWRLDAARALKPGVNEIEFRVANLWPNRLIADAALPPEKRITWTTWNPFTKDSMLLPSGLLGPVRLLVEKRD
jgi:glycosyl hydrolase family 106( putative alpha-L-rhamnosidase)